MKPHVHLTEANVAFALSEIYQSTLHNNDVATFNFKIEKKSSGQRK